MVEEFHPGGETQKTAAPHIRQEEGQITIETEVEGASLTYRIDDGKWKLYVGPIKEEGISRISAKAVRYGWEESEEIELHLEK